METITQPTPKKRGLSRSIKRLAARVWNACLPDTLDIHWMMVLGKLELTPVSISTCWDGWGGYSPNPQREYLPEITLLEVSWPGLPRRRLLGYQLQADYEYPEEDEEEDDPEVWYWHRVSMLFFDFYFEAGGLLKLRLEP